MRITAISAAMFPQRANSQNQNRFSKPMAMDSVSFRGGKGSGEPEVYLVIEGNTITDETINGNLLLHGKAYDCSVLGNATIIGQAFDCDIAETVTVRGSEAELGSKKAIGNTATIIVEEGGRADHVTADNALITGRYHNQRSKITSLKAKGLEIELGGMAESVEIEGTATVRRHSILNGGSVNTLEFEKGALIYGVSMKPGSEIYQISGSGDTKTRRLFVRNVTGGPVTISHDGVLWIGTAIIDVN